MHAVLNDQLYTPSQVARLCQVNPATIWRWQTKGIGPQKIKLQAVRVGGRVRIPERNFNEFIKAINESPPEPKALTKTSRASSARSKRAADELEKLGV